ncbi:MAG: LysR family transcriptional regulator [Proteobacteria bacterium]|nr:LysR family transcriptional regulator [Pseudomonadota bacterium]
MSRLPLHALPGFIAAARTGNLSRAADSLHLTVSALSHQIKALEIRLNRTLFVRGARGITLTEDGRRLLERIGPHYDGIESALRPYAARHDDILTVSVTPSVTSAWLVPRLGRFLANHPELELSVLSDSALVDFARDTHIDAALRIGDGQWSGLQVELLMDEWLVPVASPDLIDRHGGVPTPESLREWPLLGDPDDEWNHWFAQHGLPPVKRYVATFNDSEAQNRAAREGVGVGLGRLTRVRLMLASGQLVALTAQPIKASYAHYLVYPARSIQHRGMQVFRDWLHQQVRADVRSFAKLPLPRQA